MRPSLAIIIPDAWLSEDNSKHWLTYLLLYNLTILPTLAEYHSVLSVLSPVTIGLFSQTLTSHCPLWLVTGSDTDMPLAQYSHMYTLQSETQRATDSVMVENESVLSQTMVPSRVGLLTAGSVGERSCRSSELGDSDDSEMDFITSQSNHTQTQVSRWSALKLYRYVMSHDMMMAVLEPLEGEPTNDYYTKKAWVLDIQTENLELLKPV